MSRLIVKCLDALSLTILLGFILWTVLYILKKIKRKVSQKYVK